MPISRAIYVFFFCCCSYRKLPVILARNGLPPAPKSTPCKRIQIPKSGKLLFLESGILGFEILSGCPWNDCKLSLPFSANFFRFSSLLAAGNLSRGGTSAPQWQKFHTDDINNVYITYPLVMGFQRQMCSILRFPWSILVKFCVHLETSSSKTQMLLPKKNIFRKYWLFCYRFMAFTFDLCSLLSFVRHS